MSLPCSARRQADGYHEDDDDSTVQRLCPALCTQQRSSKMRLACSADSNEVPPYINSDAIPSQGIYFQTWLSAAEKKMRWTSRLAAAVAAVRSVGVIATRYHSWFNEGGARIYSLVIAQRPAKTYPLTP